MPTRQATAKAAPRETRAITHLHRMAEMVADHIDREYRPDALLTMQETSRLFGYSYQTFKTMRLNGQLPLPSAEGLGPKTLRFRVDDILAFLHKMAAYNRKHNGVFKRGPHPTQNRYPRTTPAGFVKAGDVRGSDQARELDLVKEGVAHD